ncbi:MAG: MFS transporter [Panacagrimonas sp.]
MSATVGLNPAYKLGLLASLYLAQGIPFGFFTQALPVLMRESGHSLKAIGATGLLFLPWALKFMIAPAVDRSTSRKAWILSMQISTTVGALLLMLVDLNRGMMWVFAALLLFNLFAATQDVATDGLAVRLLSARERGLGNGVQVGAYRIGMVLGGGFLLWLFANSGWAVMFAAMAALLLLSCIPVWSLPATHAANRPEPSPRHVGWTERIRSPGLLMFVGLACCYKFGDAMAAALIAPFMVDAGWGTEQIALIKGSVGSVMGLAGAALGGWMAFSLGRRPAILLCGLLQATSLLGYLLCTQFPESFWLLATATTAEHLLGGTATVALFTLMMDASATDHASTDYSLMACGVVVAGGVAAFAAGTIGDWAGFGAAFSCAALLSFGGCIAMVLAIDQGRGPARLSAVWPPRP